VYHGIFFCDIDGTLIPHGQAYASPSLVSLMREAPRSGWLFCIDSGRMYPSVRRAFPDMEDHMVVTCSTGGRMFWQGKEIGDAKTIDRETVEKIAKDTLDEGYALLVAADETLYILGREGASLDALLARQHATVRLIHHLDVVEGNIHQLTVVYPLSDPQAVPFFQQRWGGVLNVATSGSGLIDLAPANKGDGVRRVLDYFGVPVQHSWAFGDDENDVPMFQAVAYPFVMENASESLKRRFPLHCRSVEETVRDIMGSPAPGVKG
jgi:Cof subfamily protein (haloacid dehalogenase superfamily)